MKSRQYYYSSQCTCQLCIFFGPSISCFDVMSPWKLTKSLFPGQKTFTHMNNMQGWSWIQLQWLYCQNIIKLSTGIPYSGLLQYCTNNEQFHKEAIAVWTNQFFKRIFFIWGHKKIIFIIWNNNKYKICIKYTFNFGYMLSTKNG